MRFLSFGIGLDGVVAMSSPGVTSTYSPNSHPETFKNSPLIDCIYHIVGTGRCIATIGSNERRNGRLVKANGQNKDFFKHYISE